MQVDYPLVMARFYDLIYHQIRDGVDDRFFINEINSTKGSVLEIGVGTGRLFTRALNQGADIYGIDISPSMIRVLLDKIRKEEQDRISIQNIIDFRLDKKFALVIAPFRVFMHLADKKDQIEALNNVCRHMEPGGKFIFDVFIPDLRQLLNGLTDHIDFEGEYEPGKSVKRIVTTKPDLVNQLINITFRFEWQEEKKLRSEEWKFALRYFFRFELEYLLERSEFNSYDILGDYLGNPLSADSKEFILICHKRTW
jgi:SAM-dependent methyltransferase